MEERLANIESRLATVEQRLNRIEGQSPGAPMPDDVELAPVLGGGFLANASTLIGRVLLIFGGAYLLRAITDFQFVPTAFGISLGATYGLFWLFMAFRKDSDGQRRTSAIFYGGASILLVLPLLAEATGRFELLSGLQGIIALTLFSALSLWVFAVRDLKILAWLITAGGIVTAIAVMRLSRSAIPVSAFLIILGIGTLWTCYSRQWKGPQWLGALGANVGVLTLALLSTSDQWTVEPLSAFRLGAFLLATYLVSFAIWSHLRGEDVGIFEAIQAMLVVVVAFLVASLASQGGQLAMAQVGILSLVLSASAYALAFAPRTRANRGRNFFFYSTLGLLLLVVGSALVLSPGIAAAAWSLLALTMAWFSGRYERVALSLQCTFLLLAAGVSSGILATGLQALVGDTAASWPPLVPWHVIIALTTVACLFIPVAQHSDRWGALAGMPQLIVLALSVWEVGGLMVVYVAPVLASAGTSEPNAAIIAALRTAVLSASSVTLALSSRFKRWPRLVGSFTRFCFWSGSSCSWKTFPTASLRHSSSPSHWLAAR